MQRRGGAAPSCPLCVSPVQARTKELEGLQSRVEELQAQVLSMEGTKGWFERRLKEAEVIITHCPLGGGERDLGGGAGGTRTNHY